MSLLDRLRSEGPKRLLALDGGGIRGALSLPFLKRIESILRRRHSRPRLRLCDYFDLIGGTSTGSIIAAGLAIGMEVAELQTLYLDLGAHVFSRRKVKVWEALYNEGPLLKHLARFFGERTLGDPSIATGLCVVAKRADTGGTWPLINHPEARFYAKNKDIPLRDVVRASTAAPLFFVPQRLEVGDGEVGAFVDGGVSMCNNPALQLLLVATLKGFPFRWPLGRDRLLLVSVGTGVWKTRRPVDEVIDAKAWDWPRQVPNMLMSDASSLNQLILQWISDTPTPWLIDSEVGDLSADRLAAQPLLSYLRYNATLEEEPLRELGLAELAPRLESLRKMNEGGNAADLQRVGAAAAGRQVKPGHLPRAFDLAGRDPQPPALPASGRPER